MSRSKNFLHPKLFIMRNAQFPFFQVDAFTDQAFGGNPAAVIPLEEWLDDQVLQLIALENNLSETAFIVPNKEGYHLRWFTPTKEVELCGHATLASGYVVLHFLQPTLDQVVFSTNVSGKLTVSKYQDKLVMDFPLIETKPMASIPNGLEGYGLKKAFDSRNLILELSSEAAVRDFVPDLDHISQLHPHGVAITALSATPGIDFVSRYFVPNYGIPEDPVTGSLHCALADLWSKRLGKKVLSALQVSQREGRIDLEVHEDRVFLFGKACLMIKGTFDLSGWKEESQRSGKVREVKMS